MPTNAISYAIQRVDFKALDTYVRSRGLTPKDRKWGIVRARVRHRFLLK